MPTDATFRLTTHIALGLACLCLGYAEWDLLPEVTVFTAIVIVLLIVSYLSGGRYELNIAQANKVGLAIGVVAALWVGWQIVRPSGGLVYQLPWPISLLPYLGPLLMVLIPAKLFRPKHVGDWWAMHGIGLVAVGLASVMTEDAAFGVLLALYALAGVASLTAFYYRRAAGALPPAPGTPDAPVGIPASSRTRRPRLVGRAVGRTALAVGLALPVFFLTPRSPGSRWQFGSTVLETGFAADQMIDLNRTGELRENPEVAFEVTATFPDGRPKADLDPDQHWRGVAYRTYENGRWTLSQQDNLLLFTSRGQPRVTRTYQPPDLGPGQFQLDFRPISIDHPVLADPVTWAIRQPSPIVDLRSDRPWHPTPDGGFAFPHTQSPPLGPYRQYCRPPDEPGLGSANEMTTYAFRQQGKPLGMAAIAEVLTTVRSTRVRTWARAKLDDLIRTGKLSAGVLDRAGQTPQSLSIRVAPADYEAVARAFRAEFAESGEFRYALELRRDDKTIDPIEDFLFNTKVGHCQRFASALALTLRAIGVPAAFVLGFRGCENRGAGEYLVRQEQAHAWVEVLVPRPTPADGLGQVFDPPDRVWHWLSVDPTPDTVESGPTPMSGGDWLGSARQSGAAFFDDFIIGYDPDRRERVVRAVGDHVRGYGWAYLVGLGLIGVAVRGWSRWPTGPGPGAVPRTGVVWFDDMVALLGDVGLSPRPGQTPGEFVAAAAATLRASPSAEGVADVPLTVGRAFYQTRYADRPPTAEEQATLTKAVARLRTGLASFERPTSERQTSVCRGEGRGKIGARKI